MLKLILSFLASTAAGALPGPFDSNPYVSDLSIAPPTYPPQYVATMKMTMSGGKNASTNEIVYKITAATDSNSQYQVVNWNDGDTFTVHDGQANVQYQAMKAMDDAICFKSTNAGFFNIFPDLSQGYYSTGETTTIEVNGAVMLAYVFQQQISRGGSMDAQSSFYVSANESRSPLRWDMHARNQNVGAHTDNYSIEYTQFTTDADTFRKASNLPDTLAKKCEGQELVEMSSGPSFDGTALLNKFFQVSYDQQHPESAALISGLDDSENMESLFNKFNNFYNKQYTCPKEKQMRMENFSKNLLTLAKMDKEGHANFRVTGHLDKSEEELGGLARGFVGAPAMNMTGVFPGSIIHTNVPEAMDWRTKDPQSMLKPGDQAVCGSCWSFSFAAAVESQYYLLTKEYVKVPEQFVIDCSWNFEAMKQGKPNNMGCNGGMQDVAAQRIIELYEGKIPSLEQYGNYKGMDSQCTYKKDSPASIIIKGWNTVPFRDTNSVMAALNQYGPLAISFNANPFVFYSSGIVMTDACYNTQPNQLDHAVLLIGYGSASVEGNNVDYWSLKNQWSVWWGLAGYFYVERGIRDCGVSIAAGWPTVARADKTDADDAELVV